MQAPNNLSNLFIILLVGMLSFCFGRKQFFLVI
jgi:hypothetical protein